MAKYCFGVDLGGTSVKLGLFDPEGTVLEKCGRFMRWWSR